MRYENVPPTPSPEQPPLAPYDPPEPAPQAKIWDGALQVEKKQAVAIGIALQTQVMKACPIHRQLYFDDDVNPAGAFALAIELVRTHKPFVREFEDDEHALTDLLSATLSDAPVCCLVCAPTLKPRSSRPN